MTVEELIKKNRDDVECKYMTICLCKAKNEDERLKDLVFWEGNLLDIPEEYYSLVVVNISRLLSEIQSGSVKFYIQTVGQ